MTQHFLKIPVIAAGLAFSTAFAQLSGSCNREVMDLLEEYDSDIKELVKDLAPEVVKVKAQLKLPFGKPADSKKTDIGLTVGCIKQFPESASAIAPMLKGLGSELTKGKAASKSGAKKNGGGGADSGRQSTAKGAGKDEAKDVIYMLDGQEIKNASIVEIGIDEIKYKVGARAAAYVVRRTDISSILHADGEKEFFCNGILYPATHFCHTDGKTYSCDGKPYNPATQSCSDNVIHEKCGDKHYNPTTQFCFGSVIYEKCENKPYNPETQFCSDNVIHEKCDGKPYNLAKHFCFNSAIYEKCGNKPYSPEIQSCSGNVILEKCSDKLYNPATHACFNNAIYEKCGNDRYDPVTHFCHTDGKTYSCGGKPYNPATHSCEWSNIFERK